MSSSPLTSANALPRVAYVIPTRDRPGELAGTLERLAALPRHAACVIVVDNASTIPTHAPGVLAGWLPVEVHRSSTNLGAAARNTAALAAGRGVDWLVMLDDDSAPLDAGFLAALADAERDTAVVAAEIMLENTGGGTERPTPREAGGLPEVFIGCGAAIRRDAFLECGGYDPAFGYYAEEYDHSAKVLAAGLRVQFDHRFRVEHRKSAAGRDMNTILARLVRNNGWVMQRYAPAAVRRVEVRRVADRYRRIAELEHASAGFESGLRSLRGSLREQRRSPLSGDCWDRFIGLTACREALAATHARRRFRTAALTARGKNDHVILGVLAELGVRVLEGSDAERDADAVVIGTLSPGPMLDAFDRRGSDPRVIMPWDTRPKAAPTTASNDLPAAPLATLPSANSPARAA